MPYSASDKESLPENVQAMSAEDRKQWVAVWNSTYEACIADDGSKDKCEGKAFSTANGVINKKEQSMELNPLQKLWLALRAIFAEAGVEVDATPKPRTIAGSQLSSKVREELEKLNAPSYKMDPETGGMYLDWESYLSPMDIYYDSDGSLFVLCSRGGKLYRLPVDVSEDGETVELGDPMEISLTGRTAMPSSFKIVRNPETGAVRWFAIAASAVLNRVGEVDSTILFDNFIRRATDSGKYPILSFYHEAGVIRLGQADWLGRSDYLYLAAGTFDDSEDGKAAQRTLEADTEGRWGNSIGYFPIGAPEWMEVSEGVSVPVYVDGTNEEISIVLERDAAAYFTRVSTEEVKRAMRKNEYDALVLMFGKPRADELAAEIDGTNRSIESSDQVRRDTATEAPAVPATEAPAATETPVVAAPVTQREETAAPATPAVFEIPEEMFNALAEALSQHIAPAIQTASDNLLATLNPRLEALEAGARTAQTAMETRFAALEQTEEERHKEWLADMPAQTRQTMVIRPREARSAEASAPSYAEVAAQTTASMKTRQPAASK